MTTPDLLEIIRAVPPQNDERKLQASIAHRLVFADGPGWEREHPLESRANIIDFYHPERRIGIEVKTTGSRAEAINRQLLRYVLTGLLDELILVTTRTANPPASMTHEGRAIPIYHVQLLLYK